MKTLPLPALALILSLAALPALAQQTAPPKINAHSIGGVVADASGPEAGVWVIAETTDLPTRYVKIVATDDKGRFVIPDLPPANYDVWVRGYGLVDSARVKSAPGKILALTAVPAPDARAAAQYYPAIYWYSLLTIPDKSQFPGTGDKGNGIPPVLKDQGQWLDIVKTDGCNTCHQIGNLATRTLSPALGHFDRTADAWLRRVSSGQGSNFMVRGITRLGPQKGLDEFADWTDRIAAGALPFDKPQRPQGIERNVVITEWDWASPTTYLHDAISTDKRNPRVNAYGLIYGSPEESTDDAPVLDPVHNTVSTIHLVVRDPKTPTTRDNPMFAPSPYWGTETVWNSQTNTHNPMFDEKGRVWFTSRIRPPEDPDWCKTGSSQVSAKLFPLEKSDRQLEMYDPKTKKFTTIDTCFGTHHLQFDRYGRLLTSSGGGGDVVGWLDVKKFEKTHDEKSSQVWSPLVLDTNADGKRDDYVQPNQPVDPKKDKRIAGAYYGVAPSPTDDSIWGSVMGFPGSIVHVIPGKNPPATTLSEVFELPWKNPKAPVQGYSPRGMDIGRDGIVWAPLASGHLARFDRRACKGPLNGPAATGQQCPEGWTLYPFPGPQFQGITDSGSAEASYYVWVDQFNTFGLGNNVPVATGNQSDALFALVDGKWVTLRVPYPIGFFVKNLDGRIDSDKAGWKGKGLWTTYGNRTPQHEEGGKGNKPKVLHFQLRPDPLAD